MRIGSLTSELWTETMGVVQGCVGGPPSFKIFTNDIRAPKNVDDILRSKYADDTSDLVKAMTWLAAEIKLKFSICDMAAKSLANLLTLNLSKSKTIPLFSKSNQKIGDCHRDSDWVRYLGIYIDSNLTFSKHISVILGRLNKSFSILRTCKNFMPYKFRICAARALLNSDLYFSIEIVALASSKR